MMISYNGAVFKLSGLLKMLLLKGTPYGDVVFGDAYMDGDISISGNLADWLQAQGSTRRWLPYWPTTSRRVADHYDVTPEFYRIMLGDSMTYTCANFSGLATDLNSAQRAKISRHADWLREGERLRHLDCGCGWGTFAGYLKTINPSWQIAALTLSPEQATYAASHHRGIKVLPRSWEAHNVERTYESFSSIGMLEHVGQEKILDYFKWVERILTLNGVGVLQFCSRITPISKWADKHTMPDCYPPSVNEVVNAMSLSGLKVTDLIECGYDYATTCEHWLNNIESNLSEIKALGYDDRFIRMYRLFLSGGIVSFRRGDTQLIQLRFCKS